MTVAAAAPLLVAVGAMVLFHTTDWGFSPMTFLGSALGCIAWAVMVQAFRPRSAVVLTAWVAGVITASACAALFASPEWLAEVENRRYESISVDIDRCVLRVAGNISGVSGKRAKELLSQDGRHQIRAVEFRSNYGGNAYGASDLVSVLKEHGIRTASHIGVCASSCANVWSTMDVLVYNKAAPPQFHSASVFGVSVPEWLSCFLTGSMCDDLSSAFRGEAFASTTLVTPDLSDLPRTLVPVAANSIASKNYCES